MTDQYQIADLLKEILNNLLISCNVQLGETTCEVLSTDIFKVCKMLRDHPETQFDQLIDLCGVDYSSYRNQKGASWKGTRYAVVYHLMSINHNIRVRIRASVEENQPKIKSLIEIWPAADWFEREAFDLYGIIFIGHPDLRRLLTDYGFVGHPFRKDFPLSGTVEMRYDEKQGRVIYEPINLNQRITVPRTIRNHQNFSKDKKNDK